MRKAGWRAIAMVGVAAVVATALVQPAAAGEAEDDPVATGAVPDNTKVLYNPIRENSADPFLFTYKGDYYLTVTRGDRVVIIKSPSAAGLATAPETTVREACCQVWAPEFHLIDGRWYAYYSARPSQDVGHQIYVAQSAGSDPMGPYTYKGKLNTGPGWAIDGTILKRGDKRYLLWSGGDGGGDKTQDLYAKELSSPTQTTGSRTRIATPKHDWEKEGGQVNEAPAVAYHDGKAYVAYSASQCKTADYSLGLLTLSGDPLEAGSWAKKSTPIFKRADARWVFGPGHNSFFKSPDGKETWQAYHALTSEDGSVTGQCGPKRTLRIQKVTFNADGSPKLGTPLATWQPTRLPSGDPGPAALASGKYTIVNADTGKTLDLDGCKAAPGAKAIVRSTPSCGVWQVTNLGSGLYKITGTGGSLDVGGCSNANGARIGVWTYNGHACQRWRIQATTNGGLRLTPESGGRPVRTADCSTSEAAKVDVWSYHGAACQRWHFRKA